MGQRRLVALRSNSTPQCTRPSHVFNDFFQRNGIARIRIRRVEAAIKLSFQLVGELWLPTGVNKTIPGLG